MCIVWVNSKILQPNSINSFSDQSTSKHGCEEGGVWLSLEKMNRTWNEMCRVCGLEMDWFPKQNLAAEEKL